MFELPPELLASDALPSPPGVVLEVLRLVGDDDTTIEELTAVLETDPALATRLLRTVNSGLYALSRQIGNIDQAAVLLGFRAVRSLALGGSVAGLAAHGTTCQGFDVGRYWRHSLLCAAIGRELATEVDRRLSDDVFTIGLIANLGRLVLATGLPERYAALLADDPWPSGAAETAHLGFPSAQVSAALLHRWGLPDSVCFAVRHIDGTDALDDDLPTDTRTVTLVAAAASSAVTALLDGGDAVTALQEMTTSLDLAPDVHQRVLGHAVERVDSVAHLVGDALPADLRPDELVERAQELLASPAG